jgi:hypothetical protein
MVEMNFHHFRLVILMLLLQYLEKDLILLHQLILQKDKQRQEH